MALAQQAGKTPDAILPTTSDTRAALLAIAPSGWSRENLDSVGYACPESYATGGIGYIYIGDGLRLGEVEGKRIPVIFCPASNHRGSVDICRAWPTAPGGIDNREMMVVLEDALARAKSGAIPYSSRAVAVIERELAARKAPPPREPMLLFLPSSMFAAVGFVAGIAALSWKRTRNAGSVGGVGP